MQNSVIPTVRCEYDNELEKIEKLLDFYSISKGKPLRGFEKLVLRYYLRDGYSADTKSSIVEDTGKKVEYITSINSHLREKGYLVADTYNRNKTSLSKDMEAIRQFFVIEKKKVYAITF